ncbi:Splicing Regulator Rbm11 [Manis pentadactyla]|nr:Splicing Regulator Rbm11 [Manis pentadactyla]
MDGMHLSESCRVRETKAGRGQEEEERRDWALRDVGRSRAADVPGAEPARTKRPRLRAQPAGSSAPRPRRGASEGRGQAAAESRAGLRSARGGRGLPPVPALHIRGPGRAWGWPSAGESGRVFPPPLGQASERRRVRPSLANPAPAAARPPAFSRGPPPGLSGPARSPGWSQRLGGRAQIRARELLRARGAERRQHDTEHRGEGPGTDGDAPLDWQPGYAAPRNRCKRALLSLEQRPVPLRRGWGSSRTSRRSGEPSPQPLPSRGKFRGDANLVCRSTFPMRLLSRRLPWDTHFCSNPLPRWGSRGPATRSLDLPRGRPRSWRPEDRPSLATTFG